ncbi:MAG: rhodanese-like domain-containing protein [Taibaiella sp.]|nr:rhodanese-like domain-containing protein [Taibaiella sp.]
MRHLTPQELKAQISTDPEVLLIDVREPWEHEAYSIGGTLIPLGDINVRMNEIPKDKTVIVYCEKGIRSVIAIQRLEAAGFTNLCNLTGGMKAWRGSVE